MNAGITTWACIKNQHVKIIIVGVLDSTFLRTVRQCTVVCIFSDLKK